MLDRGSTFTDEALIQILSKSYVATATDCYYLERDAKNPYAEHYRAIVSQRSDLAPGQTTQGFYIYAPDGKLYRGWNTRGSERLKGELLAVLKEYKPPPAPGRLEEDREETPKRRPPKGTVIVDAYARITRADWPQAKSSHTKIFQTATGRERLWVLKGEASALARGKLQRSLERRIARFLLNDYTRGEPDLWTPEDLKKVELDVAPEGSGYRLTGEVELGSREGRAGYVAKLLGRIESDGSRLTRFDLVARGIYHGHGQFTKNGPPGDFTLVIATRLAPETEGEALLAPPQGAAAVYDAYLNP